MGTHRHTHIHHHYGGDTAITAKLDELLARQARLETLLSAHSDALAALTVTSQNLADDATLTVQATQRMESILHDLKVKLDQTDPDDTDQITALQAQVKAADDQLVALTSGVTAITDPPAPAPALPSPPASVATTSDSSTGSADSTLDPAGNPVSSH